MLYRKDFKMADRNKSRRRCVITVPTGSSSTPLDIDEDLRELSLKFPWLLSRFPTFDLGKLPHLKVLKLDSSNIDELPQSIGLLSNLEELEISRMRRLRSLPSEIERLVNLKALRLRDLHYSFSLPEGLLGRLPSMETFSAEDFEIVDMLQNMDDINTLKILSLKGAKFDILPETIGGMSSLEALDLRSATLSSLPDSIGDLRNLKQVDLRFCSKVVSLPDSIGNLVNLKLLVLSGTGISSIPESIGTLGKLKHLYLSECYISSLPFSIGNLVQLRTLDLSTSMIESFPDSVGNLVNLKELDIRLTRKLSTLPDEFKNLTGLEILLLTDSGVSAQSLPSMISNLKNLRVMIIPQSYLGDDPSPREDSLLEILEACPKLGCIGQHLGRFDCCCGNAACFCQSKYIPTGVPSTWFGCHKELRHSHKTIIYSLVRNKIRSQIFYPSNSRTMTYPPLSLWPLIIERVENAAKFEYYCRKQNDLLRIDGEKWSNCLPQADVIFQLLVDHGETIVSHATTTRKTEAASLSPLGRDEEMIRPSNSSSSCSCRPRPQVSAEVRLFLQRTKSKRLRSHRSRTSTSSSTTTRRC